MGCPLCDLRGVRAEAERTEKLQVEIQIMSF
jgi:hypothetical protein